MFEKNIFIAILMLNITACNTVDDVNKLQITADEARKVVSEKLSVCMDRTSVDRLKRSTELLNKLNWDGSLSESIDWTVPDKRTFKGQKAWAQRLKEWHLSAKIVLSTQTMLGIGERNDAICRAAISTADEYLRQFD